MIYLIVWLNCRNKNSSNNPVKYTDPTGHCIFGGVDTLMCIGALVGVGLYTINSMRSGQDWQLKDAALAAGLGAVSGLLIGGAALAVGAGVISTTVGAVMAGTGTGLAAGGGGYMIANSITKNKSDAGDFAIASGVGAATGAAGPLVGTTWTGAALLNGASGAVQYEATYYHHYHEFDLDDDVVKAAGFSAISTLISGPYTNPNTLFDDIRPMPQDSAAYWRQKVNGYDPIYNPKSPYATTLSGANLFNKTIKQQLPGGLAGGAASNWAFYMSAE